MKTGFDSAERAAEIPMSKMISIRDWGFVAQPDPHLNDRAIPLSMGKVLGGRVKHQCNDLGPRA
jgi:hypothetical protein